MARIKEIKTGKLDHMKRQNYFKTRQVQFCKIEEKNTEYYVIKLFRYDDKSHRRASKQCIQFKKSDVVAVHRWEAKEEKKKLLRSQTVLRNHVILFIPEPVVFLEKSSDDSLESLELLEWYNCFVNEFGHRQSWEVQVPENDFYKPGKYWLHLMEQSLCLVCKLGSSGPVDPAFTCYDHYLLRDVEVAWTPGILDMNIRNKQRVSLRTDKARDIVSAVSNIIKPSHNPSEVRPKIDSLYQMTPYPPDNPDVPAREDFPPPPPLRPDIPVVKPSQEIKDSAAPKSTLSPSVPCIPPRPPKSPRHVEMKPKINLSLEKPEVGHIDKGHNEHEDSENGHASLVESVSNPLYSKGSTPQVLLKQSISEPGSSVDDCEFTPPAKPTPRTMPRTPPRTPRTPPGENEKLDINCLTSGDAKHNSKTEEDQFTQRAMILNIPPSSIDYNPSISDQNSCTNLTPKRPVPIPRMTKNPTVGTSPSGETIEPLTKYPPNSNVPNFHNRLSYKGSDTHLKAVGIARRSRSYSFEVLSSESDSTDLPMENIYGSAEDLYDIHKLNDFREMVLRGDCHAQYSKARTYSIQKRCTNWKSVFVQNEGFYENGDVLSQKAPPLPPRDGRTRAPFKNNPGYATLPNKHNGEDNSYFDTEYWSKEISQTLQLLLDRNQPKPDTLLISSQVKNRLCFKLSYMGAPTDWHNFAEKIGLQFDDISIIENFARFHNICPAEIVLNHWQILENNGVIDNRNTGLRHCTKHSLLGILEQIERLDLVDLVKDRDKKP